MITSWIGAKGNLFGRTRTSQEELEETDGTEETEETGGMGAFVSCVSFVPFAEIRYTSCSSPSLPTQNGHMGSLPRAISGLFARRGALITQFLETGFWRNWKSGIYLTLSPLTQHWQVLYFRTGTQGTTLQS